MIPVRVILVPQLLQDDDIAGRCVIVFDVLRATTTIASALDSQAHEIHIFPSHDAARAAYGKSDSDKLLIGESQCLKPPDFSLGNSPRETTRERCCDKTIFMSTTNGTLALLAARNARVLLAGSIVNASATAAAAIASGLGVTLLCAGTNGQVAMDDLLGCGRVLVKMNPDRLRIENDAAMLAIQHARNDPDNQSLHLSAAANRLREVGLDADIDFAGKIDRFTNHAIHVLTHDSQLIARRMTPDPA